MKVDLRIKTMLVNSTPPVGDLKMPWTSVRKANQATRKPETVGECETYPGENKPQQGKKKILRN